ncbi:MAG: hypothetical protein ACKOK8_15095 [Planctomycetia bacterium]
MKMGQKNRVHRLLSRWGATAVLAVLAAVGVADDGRPAPQTGFRRLAPGVLTVIPPRASSDSHVIRGDLLEVTKGLAEERQWTPKQAAANTTLIERAKQREFERGIWCLEFAFKPPRFIDVDVPAGDLKMQRKRLWYLVYRVRNTGGRRTVIDKDDPTKRTVEPFETPVRFVPHFVLESLEPLTEEEGDSAYRSYLDRVVPNAMGPIRRREDPARELFDSASMAATDIPPGGERWGVAVWQDIDPRIDFFTITVRGLTNAIRWREKPGATFAKDLPPAAEMEHAVECLRLDFWRPGDDRDEIDEEMNVGFAGMLERLTLGSKLLEALGRPQVVRSRPVAGLADLGLSWEDLVAAEGEDGGGPRGGDLVPLSKVVSAVATVKEPSGRGPLVRAVFGDLGVEHFEQLSRALAAPADPDRDAARRQALQGIGLTPEAVQQKPLESLAKVFLSLAKSPPGGPRRQRAEAFFGAAAPKVGSLARELSMARTLATLEDIEVNRQRLAAGDGLVAFEVILPALRAKLQEKEEPAEREALLAGLFGPRGPELYATATKWPEGIDHSWDFKYEID